MHAVDFQIYLMEMLFVFHTVSFDSSCLEGHLESAYEQKTHFGQAIVAFVFIFSFIILLSHLASFSGNWFQYSENSIFIAPSQSHKHKADLSS